MEEPYIFILPWGSNIDFRYTYYKQINDSLLFRIQRHY